MNQETRNASIRDSASWLISNIPAEQRKWLADQRAYLDKLAAYIKAIPVTATKRYDKPESHEPTCPLREGTP